MVANDVQVRFKLALTGVASAEPDYAREKRLADEVVHSILNVMYADQPYTLIQRAMAIHPTVSELVPTLLEQLKPLA